MRSNYHTCLLPICPETVFGHGVMSRKCNATHAETHTHIIFWAVNSRYEMDWIGRYEISWAILLPNAIQLKASQKTALGTPSELPWHVLPELWPCWCLGEWGIGLQRNTGSETIWNVQYESSMSGRAQDTQATSLSSGYHGIPRCFSDQRIVCPKKPGAWPVCSAGCTQLHGSSGRGVLALERLHPFMSPPNTSARREEQFHWTCSRQYDWRHCTCRGHMVWHVDLPGRQHPRRRRRHPGSDQRGLAALKKEPYWRDMTGSRFDLFWCGISMNVWDIDRSPDAFRAAYAFRAALALTIGSIGVLVTCQHRLVWRPPASYA